jgi:hypothetical protein
MADPALERMAAIELERSGMVRSRGVMAWGRPAVPPRGTGRIRRVRVVFVSRRV